MSKKKLYGDFMQSCEKRKRSSELSKCTWLTDYEQVNKEAFIKADILAICWREHAVHDCAMLKETAKRLTATFQPLQATVRKLNPWW